MSYHAAQTRKRNAEFPGGTGEKSNLEQPVRGVHVGELSKPPKTILWPEIDVEKKKGSSLTTNTRGGGGPDSSPASAIERAVYVARQNKCEELLGGRMQIIK